MTLFRTVKPHFSDKTVNNGLHIKAFNPLNARRELGRIVEEKKNWEKARGALYLGKEKEHLVRRYPGNARSSF
jgi:hypothetical protein